MSVASGIQKVEDKSRKGLMLVALLCNIYLMLRVKLACYIKINNESVPSEV